MIKVKPKVENGFCCPECQSAAPAVNDILIHAVHSMADCTCLKCGLEFYQILPIGHNVEDQLSVHKKKAKYYPTIRTESWLFDSLVKAYEGSREQEVKIEKILFKHCEHVIILNTLDFLYGHVLLKLYNSTYHLDHQKDLGLIVIVPKAFEWLIPTGCAEAWIVNLKLSELAYNHQSIQNFVAEQFKRFQTIYLSKAYSHPDFTKIDISRFTTVQPFDLAKFKTTKPTVTFILREDRWWFPTIADYWFFRVCRKLRILTFGARVLSLRQNVLVRATIRKLRRSLPGVTIYLAGLGQKGSFKGYGRDVRKSKVEAFTEIAWCRIYSESHVVVGIHGSNMLLPTALAAGCVEILPSERYGNMVQDISVRYNDRRQLFFYRFCDQYASPRSVAAKVLSMITDYDGYHKNMCRHLYKE